MANDFAIAEEVTLKGPLERRPDLVLYVNGLALGVVEFKRSAVSIGDGIRQLISNQQPAFNGWFFPTAQILLCTIPTNSVLAAEWDSSSMMMEARILRPLRWFGLADHRREAIEGQRFGERHFYRKTELFDRFLSFDVKTEASASTRH